MLPVDYFLLAYRGIRAGERYSLNNKPSVKMGRNIHNDVPFDFADVADYHIQIEWVGNNHHELLVLGHSMTTRINERPLLPSMRYPLKSGDMIELGRHVAFQYMAQAQSASASAQPNHPPKQGAYPNNPPQNSVYPNNPPYNPSAVVVAPPVAPIRKDIPVIRVSQAPLTHPTRIGCHFCFYTLDPNDPDEALRSFVKVGTHHYHQTCYDQLNPKPHGEPIVAKIEPIRALEWRNKTPLLVNLGPTNTLEDVPLGISAGTVTFHEHAPLRIELRNNSTHPIAVSRLGYVSWVYLSHEHPQIGYRYPNDEKKPNYDYVLMPAQAIYVTLVPHVVRPSFVTKVVSLIDHRHVVDVESGGYSVSFLASLMAGVIVAFAHVSVLLVWSVSIDVWVMLFIHLLSSTLMLWWMVYMIPGRLLAISDRLTKWAFRLGERVGGTVYRPMSRLIRTNRLPTLMQNPADYIGFSLVVALAVVGLVYIPIFGVMSLFPTMFRYFFSAGYLVVLVHIFNVIIHDYGDDTLYPTQRMWHNIIQFIREVAAMNAGDFSRRGTGT